MKNIAIKFLMLLSLASVAHAASFDCAKASTPIEKTICGDTLLGQLDDALGENYKSMSHSNIGDGAINDLKTSQRSWMKERNKCADKKCLEESYRKRIDAVCDYPVIKGSHPSCIDSDSVGVDKKNSQAQVMNQHGAQSRVTEVTGSTQPLRSEEAKNAVFLTENGIKKNTCMHGLRAYETLFMLAEKGDRNIANEIKSIPHNEWNNNVVKKVYALGGINDMDLKLIQAGEEIGYASAKALGRGDAWIDKGKSYFDICKKRLLGE